MPRYKITISATFDSETELEETVKFGEKAIESWFETVDRPMNTEPEDVFFRMELKKVQEESE